MTKNFKALKLLPVGLRYKPIQNAFSMCRTITYNTFKTKALDQLRQNADNEKFWQQCGEAWRKLPASHREIYTKIALGNYRAIDKL